MALRAPRFTLVLTVFVVYPAVAALIGYIAWKVTGESDQALGVGMPGTMAAVGVGILGRADRLRLTETARALWVSGGLVITVLAWCLYIAVGP